MRQVQDRVRAVGVVAVESRDGDLLEEAILPVADAHGFRDLCIYILSIDVKGR